MTAPQDPAPTLSDVWRLFRETDRRFQPGRVDNILSLPTISCHIHGGQMLRHAQHKPKKRFAHPTGLPALANAAAPPRVMLDTVGKSSSVMVMFCGELL